MKDALFEEVWKVKDGTGLGQMGFNIICLAARCDRKNGEHGFLYDQRSNILSLQIRKHEGH